MTPEQISAVIERETGTGVHAETPLDALGCDSLELVALVIELERESGKEMPEEKWSTLETVGDLIREFA